MTAGSGSTPRKPGIAEPTRTGRPIEGSDVLRSFHRLSEKADLPRIQVHNARHGAATLPAAGNVAASPGGDGGPEPQQDQRDDGCLCARPSTLPAPLPWTADHRVYHVAGQHGGSRKSGPGMMQR